MKRQLIIALTIFLLIASISICSADRYVGGVPPVTVSEGTVSGGVYFDSYYGSGNQKNYEPITIDKTFTVPSHTDVEWAMLLTTVYCGNMKKEYEGTAKITFNGEVLGEETLDKRYIYPKGDDNKPQYLEINDHVIRVTSDYMMWYDVTDRVTEGDNLATVYTEQIHNSFDGRIKLITLIVAYNDGSDKTIHYWVNQGEDMDCYYSDPSPGQMETPHLDPPEDYIGSTTFTSNLASDITLQNVELTAVHIASIDGSYTFNDGDIASGTPQGTYCGSNIWDITSSFIPDGTNTLTYNRTGDFYKIAFGILTAQYQETAAETNLDITDISVKHNYVKAAWEDLTNTVDVTVVNNGPDIGSFNVVLHAGISNLDSEVGTISVPGLTSGESTIVRFDWTPDEANQYNLKAVAENAELTIEQLVKHNGYMGDKPLTTYAHDTIKGDFFFTYGDSYYSSKMFPGDTYTVNHDFTLPEGANIQFARLYNYWTWSYKDTTGKFPSMTLTFNSNSISPEKKYEDRKGWGAYNYPAGTWAYDVTSLVTDSGSFISVVTNTDPEDGSIFCMDGIGLLIVYEDPNGQNIEYWINEGGDLLSTMDTSGGLTPEEATATTVFQGSVDLSNVQSAELWTVVQSGGEENNKLIFNSKEWLGVYDGTPYPDLDIDEARPVKDHLVESDNTAMIRGAPYEEDVLDGDYLMPSNAFLILTYGETSDPALSLSANPTTVVVGESTDVTFTVVTSVSSPVEGASITLTGCADGSGTTDGSGVAVISVNAGSEGTITATASKDSYISSTTTLTSVTSTTPTLSLSASQTTVIVGESTDVTFTVISDNSPVEGVTITLTGCADGSGTTDATGKAVISVNAGSEGTITATASKVDYTDATITLTAKEKGEGASSSVSLNVKIKPAISFIVTPNSINFGDLSPGDISDAHTLTLKNKGVSDFTVTAQVSDSPTDDTLFKDGLLLNSATWNEYTTSIVAQASDTADASLDVPDSYIGVGEKQGEIVFWAEA